MKKRFSPRHNILLPRKSWGIGGAVLALAALVVLLRFVAPDALVAVARPAWSFGAGVGSGLNALSGLFRDGASREAERRRLVEETATLSAENTILAERVRDLEGLLGTRSSAPEGIVAGVLARPPVSPYDILITDQGSKAGVSVGASVRGAGGIPLGTVESVTEDASRVTLYSAPSRRTEGWIGASRIPVTLIGEGAGVFSASVPRDAAIVAGDAVLIPGGGALPIGSIETIETDPSSPLATLFIRPLVNPFSIIWVTIEKREPLP